MIGKTKKRAGFTLMEIAISISILAMIIIISNRVFQVILDNQARSTVDQALQNEVKYFMERLSREARMAQMNTSGSTVCNVTNGHIFSVSADAHNLYFKHSDGLCRRYSFSHVGSLGRLAVTIGSTAYYLTSPQVDIQDMTFVVDDSASAQPLMTVNVKVQSAVTVEVPALNIQTSISPRWYEE